MPIQRPDARSSAATSCARAIEDAIVRGDYQPGDRLPPERELAVTLGVARETLRAALARVAAGGLIEMRHGVGNVVLDVSRTASPTLVGHLARDAAAQGTTADLAEDLLAIRRSLARTLLERLARFQPPAAALARFDAAIDAFGAISLGGATIDELAGADHDIVGALVALSEIPVAALFLNPVFAALREIPELRAAIYADPAENFARWKVVAGWLRSRARRAEPLLAMLEQHDAKTVAKLHRKPPRTRRKTRR